jgi:hypothetical protein
MGIRRIRADEGLKLRAFRLSALADSPMAFGSTLAREEAFPELVWHERAAGGASGADRVTFIAEEHGEWIGLATGLANDPDDPNDPWPVLVGMSLSLGHFRQQPGHRAIQQVRIPPHWGDQAPRSLTFRPDGARPT